MAENQLVKLSLKGFKTLADVQVEFRALNVLIGANGAGKSNLISFFSMLSAMLSDKLDFYVKTHNGANAFLHDGAKHTAQIEAEFTIATSQGKRRYGFGLAFGAGDSLFLARESASRPVDDVGDVYDAASAFEEVLKLLRRFAVYHFHDTSNEARIKLRGSVEDKVYLRYDAGNLAAFLLNLQELYPKYYRRIVGTIQQVAPFFEDFVFEPEAGSLLLQWRERGSEMIFNASQASDGTLRAMALIALLLQSPEKLPALLILDEPELGLHPYGITVIAGLIKAVSLDCQVLVATQSPLLLDHFEPADVLVVERNDRHSTYHRLDEEHLREWLDEYALSELWHKNILGGRP